MMVRVQVANVWYKDKGGEGWEACSGCLADDVAVEESLPAIRNDRAGAVKAHPASPSRPRCLTSAGVPYTDPEERFPASGSFHCASEIGWISPLFSTMGSCRRRDSGMVVGGGSADGATCWWCVSVGLVFDFVKVVGTHD
ncbi:uncharacterized protein LOC121994396 [Zingiber officinale]|uniref:uncharacterized protein LOC121994396 n=1 Tax=Zingiber officinale TaxID=94328 RepID=UPI001C4DCCC5|nr:uncharacterized protein LOC121994396 [Zingiber officinale]